MACFKFSSVQVSRLRCVQFDRLSRFPTILTGQFCRSRLYNMQRPSEVKRRKISDTAARLFATKPFHKVRLDDVAAAAQVGKGTLYIYFKSKEDLYVSLVSEGFTNLVEQLVNVSDLTPQKA